MNRRALPWWAYVLILVLVGIPCAVGFGWIFDERIIEQRQQWERTR